ncbi:MAG: response regulator transcription factor [Anaerolineales bacterium]|nr:response regulator transcription factor [Anaerolineales bacterium]
MNLLLVEDNPNLRPALQKGLEATGKVHVLYACESGEDALEHMNTCQVSEDLTGVSVESLPHVILMDVQLAGQMNGIEAAVAIRREFPRMPVVFYSIQDDDAYFRAFRQAGILSHYAYVRKSNYLLPDMILPLLKDAIAGRSFIDPEIENRVHEVRLKDEHNPLALLEPHEQQVAKMLASGMTNEQIAARMGFRDKRTISRVNGQIYTAWGLTASTTDEKIARTRAALIVQAGRLMMWDEEGVAKVMDERGRWNVISDK